MKRQHPTSNIQKRFKSRGSKLEAEPAVFSYPELLPLPSFLHEEGNGTDNARHVFDLEERTAKFGEAIARFSKKIPRGPTTNRLVDQLVGCGSSVGANYREANEGFSKKDFWFSISRCVKEAKETKYFLRLIAASEAPLVEEARELYREGHELHMIFASIFRKRGG